MPKLKFLTITSCLLFLLSIVPIFNMFREVSIGNEMTKRYELDSLFPSDENGQLINPTIHYGKNTIAFKEEKMGKTVKLSDNEIVDHEIKKKELVKMHIIVNQKEISKPNIINADTYFQQNVDAVRYKNWIGVVTVKDHKTKTEQIKIVQRLSDDDATNRQKKWKIITVSKDGKINEEIFEYKHRGHSPLGVEVVSFSGTALSGMGYHSNIMQGFPSIMFPFIYPFGTLLYSIIVLCVILFMRRKNKNLQM
ncbi:hypothetical protein V7146_23230 [Gottfriedia acidiceleris]|uniref:hypothetical protein n=1 Tax=Gottfriedia acidiceleris TaxID=371036 RepID=UPI0030001C9A